MIARDLFGAPAALALLGFSTATVAQAIAVPPGELEAEFFMGGVLSDEKAARLRAFLWQHGVVMIGTPFFDGALYLTGLIAFRQLTNWAEDRPDFDRGDLAYFIFARVWRCWLRITGRGHRIVKRPVAGDQLKGR